MKLTSFFNLTLHSLCCPISLSCPIICFSSSNFLKFLFMCSLYGFSFPANSLDLISQTLSPTTPLFSVSLLTFSVTISFLSTLVRKFFLALIPIFHFHSNPFSFPLSLSSHHSSLGEQIASSVLCSWRTAGNNGRVGLVVVATGMRQEREGGWGRQRRKAA